MKKTIRLTESELHEFIAENVRNIISELDWRTYASASSKAQNKANTEDDDYMRPIHDEQSINFDKAAGDRMLKQYGIKQDEVDDAIRYIDFYKSHGYYSQKLPRPSRKVFRAVSKMMNDFKKFKYERSFYRDGEWQNYE